MVYGGKPSTGCYLCRKRKIKCDEAHPECRNCIIYGRPCPGYRPDAVFRNETRKVERLVKSNAGVNSHSNSDSQNGSPTADSSMSAVSHRRRANSHAKHHGKATLTLYSPADSSWEQRALCYFFDQYTIKADADDGGHLEYLPPLYARELGRQSSESPSPCLRWAVDATALMTLANAKNAPPLMNKAREGYGRALRGLQEALASPANAVKDETFASVVLLSLYEDISGERNGLLSSHTAGFEFLMKLRGNTLVDHQRGRDMLTFAYAHTYVEILALGDKPRFDIKWDLGMLNTNDPVERLMFTVSKLCQLFLYIRSPPNLPDQAAIESWIRAGLEYDIEISQWTQTLPDRWLPLVVYSAQGEPLLTYNRLSNVVIWNYYRAVRVMVQHLLLGLNTTLISIKAANKQFSDSPNSSSGPESEPVLDESALKAVIREMTTDVCRSIPFALADVDSLGRPNKSDSAWKMRAAQGYGLLWPLWYILSSGLPTPAQGEQIRTVLSRVGSTQGIKLALVLAREAERMRGEQEDAQGEILGWDLPRGAYDLDN
ncbi:transcriptional regulator family: Fungal Specific TF [Penicillium roqueforti]|nr:transcriptional regulator family: Fungal Specific TF [Penicillium roqueforti]KAI3160210.1 transcriptional regulator family: Fungal Specific TF [Penicillium roqueforti]